MKKQTTLIRTAWLVFLASAVSLQAALAGGRSSGNGGDRGGGDGVALEFIEYGKAAVLDLKHFGPKVLPEIDPALVEQAVNEVCVSSSEEAPVDSSGTPRDAVTDLAQKTIEVSRPRWEELRDKEYEKIGLVVHEYLRAAGYGGLENRYSLTARFLAHLKKNSEWAHSTYVSINRNQEYRLHGFLGEKSLVCEPVGIGADEGPGIVRIASVKTDSGSFVTSVLMEADSMEVFQVSAGNGLLLIGFGEGKQYALTVPIPRTGECEYGTQLHFSRTAAELPIATPVRCCF